ncbi:MAG: hypothetical protein J4F99_04475 [Acidimicrobiia bacterium]|nr:hypothetical protein [Acidimicrobiia bacterium]
MFRLRSLTRLLVVVVLLATSLAVVVVSPAGAQSTVRVLKLVSAETDSNWEVQISVLALGGCDPPNSAVSGYVTSWLGPDDENGVALDPGLCNYRITAVARQVDTPGQVCEAEVSWDIGGARFSETFTSAWQADWNTIAAHHFGGVTPRCWTQPVLSVRIDPDGVVEGLPASATDSNLEARAERAAEITDFRVRVAPRSGWVGPSGCDQTFEFFVAGDGEAGELALGDLARGAWCEFTIQVTGAPPPFIIRDTDGLNFSTAERDTDAMIYLDLSEHVQLGWNRIVIIQDVVNNPANQGSAAYTISSTCAGVAELPPVAIGPGGSGIYALPGGQTVARLLEGRFTVHSPDYANFGAGASYPAVATSTTSDEIGGCSVTVSIEDLPAGCALAGSSSRTLTWTSANPIGSFDFEFDIYCGGAQPPAPEVPPPPPSEDSSGTSTEDPPTAAIVGSAEVRIVARLLGNGKIELGLQQLQHDNTWGERVFPRARLFPATASVGRWLVSSAITLSAAETADSFDGDVTVRIIARKSPDAGVEFGLQQRDNGTWSDRELPTRRFFPPTASVNRWQSSSTLSLDL